MRRGLTWLAGAIGLAALGRHLSRRRPAPVAAPPDPAAELRRKLDETRMPPAAAETDAQAKAETEIPTAEAEGAAPDSVSLDERRARLHERTHDAISAMRDALPDDPDSTSEPPSVA